MLLDDVAAVIAGAGLATGGVDLFVGESEPDPPASVTIREYGGAAPAWVYGQPDPSQEFPRFQIECRAPDYQPARLRVERCARLLGAVRDREINGTLYTRITPVGPAVSLGEDESGRARLAVSFEAAKKPSPLPV